MPVARPRRLLVPALAGRAAGGVRCVRDAGGSGLDDSVDTSTTRTGGGS